MSLPDIINDETNLRSLDRVLSLEVMDGKKPKSSTGLVDTRLFTGEQQLHLKMDIQTNLWSFRYDRNGLMPEPLSGLFTSFKKGYEAAENYFSKRNIRIKAVED